jgi:hypothetical protein
MTTHRTEKEKRLEDIAKRALSEATERKKKQSTPDMPTELGGRNGPEPTRFGDWEKKGIISDF